MTAPDFMPVLSGGPHDKPEDGACLMEYVSILAGEPFSDRPSCTDPSLAVVAHVVNDWTASDLRHLLLPFIGRLMGTRRMTDPERDEWVRRMSIRFPCPCPSGKCHMWVLPSSDAYPVMSFALDLYDELTGRTSHRELTADDYRALAGAVQS